MSDRLSTHFFRREFRCQGCTPQRPCARGGVDTVDAELLNLLESLREHFGRAVIVTSGHRCPEHNEAVGGVPDSQHLLGRAADIRVSGVSPRDVFDFLNRDHGGGLGLYKTFVHVDTRGYRARWRGKGVA